jgi:hypothetical protein
MSHEIQYSLYDDAVANAYQEGRMEDDGYLIQFMIAHGWHVIVAYAPVYCRFTDALVGSTSFFEDAFLTREDGVEAMNALYEEYGDSADFGLLPRPPRPLTDPPARVDPADVPF